MSAAERESATRDSAYGPAARGVGQGQASRDLEQAGLNRAVELLVNLVGHWQPSRWAAPAPGNRVSRAELVYGLVQEVADVAADAEGQPRRRVPRLDNDLALPDQLRVVAADLLTADPPADFVRRAVAAVTATRRAL